MDNDLAEKQVEQEYFLEIANLCSSPLFWWAKTIPNK